MDVGKIRSIAGLVEPDSQDVAFDIPLSPDEIVVFFNKDDVVPRRGNPESKSLVAQFRMDHFQQTAGRTLDRPRLRLVEADSQNGRACGGGLLVAIEIFLRSL
jgi:hypothetical protein